MDQLPPTPGDRMNWDTRIVQAMPLWVALIIAAAARSAAAWLIWTDHRRYRANIRDRERRR
jgi:hypothetical protein